MNDKASGELPAVILVVTMLRKRAVEILENAGFAAPEVDGAEEGVGLLETRPDIAVLFNDVNMPGRMNGLELVRAVSRGGGDRRFVLIDCRVVGLARGAG
jgi:CheY-like chemotaxis protein